MRLRTAFCKERNTTVDRLHPVGRKGWITVRKRLTQAGTRFTPLLDVPILCTTCTDKLIEIPDTTMFDFCNFSNGRRLDRKTRQSFSFFIL